MQKSKCKNQNAFTFLEIIIAIGIFSIGILAVISVSAQSFKSISLQQDKLIAMNLAREGIENIRNVRDENWFWKGTSDCNKDNTTTSCTNGQIYENNGDCDWRCGDEKKYSPSYKPTFILDNHLQDIDYLGNAFYNSSVDYTTVTCANNGAVLKIDNNGYYQHNSGTDSIFKRLISIKRDNDLDSDGQTNNDLQVKVMVCWKDRGQWQEISLEEHLYNWKLEEENTFFTWDYRRSITINNTGNISTLNNYQILVSLNTQSLIANGKMQTACQDIRFSDGVDSLNYWIESGCNTTSTKIWVKVPSIPASSSKTIYMYYGNSIVSSESNGNATFNFFDDFEGTSIDTSKWTIDSSTGFSVSDGNLRGTNTTGRIRTIQTFSGPFIAESRHKIVSFASNGYEILGTWISTSNAFGGFLPHSNTIFYTRTNSIWNSYNPSPVVPQNNWCLYKIWEDGSDSAHERIEQYGTTNVHQQDYPNSIDAEPITLGKRYDNNNTGQGYDGYWDWIRVRQYASPEPTISVGLEERQ